MKLKTIVILLLLFSAFCLAQDPDQKESIDSQKAVINQNLNCFLKCLEVAPGCCIKRLFHRTVKSKKHKKIEERKQLVGKIQSAMEKDNLFQAYYYYVQLNPSHNSSLAGNYSECLKLLFNTMTVLNIKYALRNLINLKSDTHYLFIYLLNKDSAPDDENDFIHNYLEALNQECGEDDAKCLRCNDGLAQVFFEPCRHLLYCSSCIRELSPRRGDNCPYCFSKITTARSLKHRISRCMFCKTRDATIAMKNDYLLTCDNCIKEYKYRGIKKQLKVLRPADVGQYGYVRQVLGGMLSWKDDPHNVMNDWAQGMATINRINPKLTIDRCTMALTDPRGHADRARARSEFNEWEEALRFCLEKIQRIGPVDAAQDDDSPTCVVCWDQDISIYYDDCGHLCLCHDCALNGQIDCCPMCRGNYRKMPKPKGVEKCIFCLDKLPDIVINGIALMACEDCVSNINIRDVLSSHKKLFLP